MDKEKVKKVLTKMGVASVAASLALFMSPVAKAGGSTGCGKGSCGGGMKKGSEEGKSSCGAGMKKGTEEAKDEKAAAKEEGKKKKKKKGEEEGKSSCGAK